MNYIYRRIKMTSKIKKEITYGVKPCITYDDIIGGR
nr:MAG TPA: hypothetical protein [Caudoviricetes sp.]